MSDIAGLHFVKVAATPKRPVRWYVYAWRGGPRIMTADGPTRPKLDKPALKRFAEAVSDARETGRDTLSAMISSWRPHSPEWKALAPSTRETWGHALDAIDAKWGTLPIAVWNDPRMVAKVVEWRDSRADTPRAADTGVTVLSQLLEWGRLRAKVTVNVAAGIPQLYRTGSRAEIVWTEDDVDRFMVAALQVNRPHMIDGLWLALTTGMRREDLVQLTWGEVGDHAIVRVARKKSRGRRRRAVVPLLPKTIALLAELRGRHREPGVETILVNSLGRPWSPGAFTAAFNQIRDLADIAYEGQADEEPRRKHLHDCRGTFVTDLCRAGLTDREIADIVAWSPESVATIRRTYVDDAAVVVALSERIRRVV